MGTPINKTWREFANFFWGWGLVLTLASTLTFAIWTTLGAQNVSSVRSQNFSEIQATHFYKALNGTYHYPPSSTVGRFLADFKPVADELRNEEKFSFPASVTTIHTANAKYGDVAFYTRTCIWGCVSGADNNASTYREGGTFNQDFLSSVYHLYNGSSSERHDLLTASYTPVGSPFPPLPKWLYIAWFPLLATLLYLVISMARGKLLNPIRQQGPAFERAMILVLATPIGAGFQAEHWMAQLSMKLKINKLERDLSRTDRPMATQLQAARAAQKRLAALATEHPNVDEVNQALDLANKTVDTLLHAAQHAKENDARRQAVSEMEGLVPHLGDAHTFHKELTEEMDTHITVKAKQIQEALNKISQNALGSGSDPKSS